MVKGTGARGCRHHRGRRVVRDWRQGGKHIGTAEGGRWQGQAPQGVGQTWSMQAPGVGGPGTSGVNGGGGEQTTRGRGQDT